MSETFGKWLYAKRKAAGLTQDELATAAGISPNYVSALEREEPNTRDGKPRQPRIDKVEAIAKALNINLNEARMAAGFASKDATFTKVKNAKEFLEVLEEVGLPLPNFAKGIKGLEQVGEKELNEVLASMIFQLSQRATSKTGEDNSNVIDFPS